MQKETIQLYLKELAAKAIAKPVHSIDTTAGFFDLGMDSKMTMEMVTTLEEKVGHELYPTLLFEYENIDELTDYLFENDANAFQTESAVVSTPKPVEPVVQEEVIPEQSTPVSQETIQQYIKELLAPILNESAEIIDAQAGFFDLGMDSKMTMNLVSTLEEKVGHELYPTLLFEYENIEELSDYLFENDKDAFTQKAEAVIEKEEVLVATFDAPVFEIEEEADAEFDVWGDDFYLEEEPQVAAKSVQQINVTNEDIAIVGLSGRYPNANNIQQFWNHLKTGNFNPAASLISETNTFDSSFFGMSSEVAENTHPQARIFIEEAWKTIEDAGYNPTKLSENYTVGVYVGALNTECQEYLHSNVANITSFYLGCTGSSISLDTQNTSSLTAIHLASNSLRQGNDDVAIAGGVYLNPQAQSEEPTTSEAVGVVLLKRLSDAERDNDRIYGVIKGSAINHSGSNIANLNAQAEVIKKAMENTEVRPEQYGYLEVFGTDAIDGLNKAFDHKNKQDCAIGNVQNNIGDAASATGIAGLTKVLLQLKHQQIVPSFYSSAVAKTAFTIPQSLLHWTPNSNQKRLAGLSSFDAGGSNAHLIIEEYPQAKNSYSSHQPALILVSAKNETQLQHQAANLLQVVEDQNVYDIAYTLQVGRQAMEERIAFFASDISDVKHRLQQYLKGDLSAIHSGNITNSNTEQNFILKGKAGKAYIATAIKEQEVEALIQLWIKGVDIDWSLLYNHNNIPNKISLPTYPFAKESFSVSEFTVANKAAKNVRVQSKHNFGLQRYTTAWTATEGKPTATEATQIVLLADGTIEFAEKLSASLQQEVIVINESTEIDRYLKVQDTVQSFLSTKDNVALTFVYPSEAYKDFAFISGLFKTAQLESRKLTTKTLGIEKLTVNAVQEIAEIIRTEQQKNGAEVQYQTGIRKERLITTIGSHKTSGIGIKDQGVYLITGGAGGLGNIFANFIALNKTTSLILTGRSATSKLSEAELNALNATYYSCDVTNKESVTSLIQSIFNTYGKLDGIIHSAGVIADSFLLKKTHEEAIKVLRPKIDGIACLDEATQDVQLDFVVYFSSMAAVTGNFGQADYASANTWLDFHAAYRNELQQQGKRHGHTVSINWPLWKDGGMQMDEASEKYVEEKWGMSALPTNKGLEAFELFLQNKVTQGIVAYGTKGKIEAKLNVVEAEKDAYKEPSTENTKHEGIAVVAMSSRFSNAPTDSDLWSNVVSHSTLGISNSLENYEGAAFGALNLQDNTLGWAELNISEEEASNMSVQEQLLFDELSKAMRTYNIERKEFAKKSTGVFIGAQEIFGNKNEVKEGQHTLAYLIPNKISYYLNLQGPSEIVNSYCTSSYVAIHKAIQCIENGECEQAIVGAVNLVSYEEMKKALSSDFGSLFNKKGETKSFSDNAEGFTRSEGVGVIIIKPLQKAIEENNKILGLIKSSAVNHGGKGFSIEAPNAKGIKKAIETSIQKSNIPVDTIDYIEAHGIANKVADAVELGAIDAVYRKLSKNPNKKWYVGTSKPTVGHSEMVSGMASIIKVLKAFEHKIIPGIAGLDTINSELKPDLSLILTNESNHWKNGSYPRRAGLNSYAVGGVNAHLILEEYKSGVIVETPSKDENTTSEEPVLETETATAFAAETSVRNTIVDLAVEVFEIEKAELDESLSPIDYDFDSVRVIAFVNRVNEHFQRNITLGQILGADDFKAMFDIFESVINTATVIQETQVVNEELSEKVIPLSEGQKGLWFVQNREPESTVYNIPIVLKVSKELNDEIITKAFTQLLKKHAALNVLFEVNEDTGETLQILQKDATHIRREHQQLTENESVEAVIKSIQNSPFDLSKEVISLHILRTENDLHVVFNIHHIVFDGSSVSVLLADFKAFVAQLQAGNELDAISVDTSYFDFIQEESDYLKSDQSHADFNFWKQQFNHTIEKLELPYDTILEDSIEKDGMVSATLNNEQVAQLKSVAKSLKTNLSVVMLSAFKLLLHKLCGNEDVIVKMPTMGRYSEKYNHSVGYYVNMILLHTAFTNEQHTFADIVSSVKSQFINSIDHVRYPFSKLLASLDSVKGKGDEYFPVSFAYQNIFSDALKGDKTSGMQIDKEYQQQLIDTYGLDVIDLKHELILQLKYRKDKFTEESIQKHLDYYVRCIQTILSNSATTVQEIELLSDTDKDLLLNQFNNTHFEYAIEGSGICEQIETHAKLQPNATAVTFREESISYGELWNRSQQLAVYLQSQGVKEETFVGIYMERSITTIISMVGTILAGGAYVPIDTDYPADRVQFIIEDAIITGNTADVNLVLVQAELQAQLQNLNINPQVKVISITHNWDENTTLTETKGSLVFNTQPKHAAYVIYTSGSTGKPKGVVIEHRSFVDLIQCQRDFFELDNTDQMVQFSNFSFDASVEQIFMPLTTGATLHIVSKEEILNPQEFEAFLLQKGITYLHAVPLFLRDVPFTPNTQLKRIVSGGDVFDQTLLENWGGKGIRIINKYGPTETTVTATEGDLEYPYTSKPIGRPMGNTQCYIVDKHLQLQPLGVVGELCIGGAGLARGYLNREDLNREKFIDNPFGEGKIYKTGDLGRWLPDGRIDFLGRVDFQVKIRGFRIELGEIETIINNHSEVQKSVLVAKEISGAKQLVAYCKVEDPKAFNAQNLKDFVAEKLPEYMVPKFVVAIDEIPVTSSGKANRKLLQSLDIEITQTTEFVAPETETEHILASIWQEVLEVSKVGLYDNFFDLGGHSLLITRLLLKTKRELGVAPSISDIFTHPTVKALAKVIDDSNKQTLSTIELVEDRTRQPLSFAQKRLWFLAKLGQSEQYHIPHFLRLKGKINTELLEKSLNYLLQRHEVLRTTFDEDAKGNVFQSPLENPTLEMEHKSASEGEIQQTCEAFIQQPFDLTKDLLMRSLLIHIAEDEYILGLSIHHIVFDGWSMHIFMNELQQVYNAYLHETEVQINPLSIQYLDYAVWENAEAEGETAIQKLAYWKDHLTGHQDVMLPLDFIRPKENSGKGKGILHRMEGVQKQQLIDFSKSSGGTLFTSLLSSVYILLNKYSGQDDLCIGIPSANREQEGIDQMIGFFVNTIVSRVQLNPQDSLQTIVQKVQQEIINGQEHQSVPFDKVVEVLQPPRDTGITPIFQVMVNYQKAGTSLQLGEATTTLEDFKYNKVKFDLSIDFVDVSETELIVSLRYNEELFAPSTAKRLLNSLVYILETLSINANSLLQHYSFLSQQDKELLINKFNKTSFSYPIEENSIQNLFKAQVQSRPNAIAIQSSATGISYKDLDAQSTQLAIYLQQQGVTPDTLVGIFMDRSIESVMAMLAILKSGGAYVPIDPDYPTHRINFILEDAIVDGNTDDKVKIVITQEQLRESFFTLDKSDEVQLIAIHQNGFEGQENTQDKTLKEVFSIDHLAYVIFTSGSTGKPKGVLIEHRSFIDLIQYQKTYFEATENDQFLQFSNFSFDASVEQIFLPLVSGATLHILPKADLLDLDNFKKLILEREITHLHAVPSFLREIPFFPNTQLKRIISGGDMFDYRVLDRWGKTGIRVIDKYGPTESTVSAIQRDLEFPFTKKHIGRPLGNTTCFVVDANENLQPIGVPGELYIGGNGLARGYLNRPELTAEKFIDNPFGTGKVYKTGDLVRWLPDGNIDFLGRIDNQVKIRGFRIELGEIESTIINFNTVKDCAVIAKDHNGSKQLVAYCLPNQEAIDLQKLRDELSAKLPEYMVPKFIIEIDEIRLTPNGKVDRKFLQAKELDITSEATFIAPTSETEKTLAAIWQQVLAVEQVGIHDNFFHLGGHSLLITKLISRINEAFESGLSVKSIFEYPTLAQLARCVEQSDATENSSIPRVEQRESQPLSSAQESLWILSELGQGDRYHIPKILQIKGDLDAIALEKSIRYLVNRHEALHTKFLKDEEGKPYQFVDQDAQFALEIADYSNASKNKEAEIKMVLKSFMNQPFDLAKDLLVRGLLIQTAAQEYLFGLCIHHIAFDGWSSGLFMKELSQVYQSYLNEEAIELPALPIQYLDYAVWQQSDAQQEATQESLYYWKTHLSGHQDLDLKTDFPRPKVASRNGKRLLKTLSQEALTQLIEYSSASKGTLFTTLLTGVYILLNKYTGQKDICLGVPVANREQKDLEGLVGFFVNTIVSRVQLEANDTLESLFTKVQNELLTGQEHQRVPFQKVVETMQPNRDSNINPIFQVMVNYLQLERSFALGNTTVTNEDFDYQKSKFDLSFDFIETKDDGLILSINYNSDLFTQETVQRFLDSLEHVLTSFSTQLTSTLGAYNILSASEQELILNQFNQTESAFEKDIFVHTLFERQVETTPNAIALRYKDAVLTYQELNSKSNQFANYLRDTKQIKEDDLVGVKLHRDQNLVAVLMGILKAGAAYVPMDVNYPEERLKYIENDSQCALVIDAAAYQIFENAKQEVSTQAPTINPNEVNLANIIYTSGTTGNPKGVMIQHSNILALLHWAKEEFNEDLFATTFAATSYCFDLSVFEFFFTLSVGKTIRLLENALEIKTYITKDEDILINTVPSSLRTCLEQAYDFSNVKAINLAGEPFPVDIAEQLDLDAIEVRNLYGPSEDTTYSTGYKLSSKKAYTQIPIGRPILNTKAYILDENLQAVPIGVPGKLYLSGDGLSKGYLNKEELTNDRFVDHAFESGERMYDTGDITKWTSEGSIDFLGRADHQVKIRGFRIELGEIETAINSYHEVAEAVVIVKEHLGSKQLIAYCVEENETLDTQALKHFLAERLPNYMIPNLMLTINAIPLTPNGKVDRKLLQSKGLEVTSEAQYVAPSSDTEKKLAAIWEEILALEQVGIHDNFFDLGGHSLLIVQLNQKIQSELGNSSIELTSFMNNPTIYQQALLVEKTQKKSNHLVTFHEAENSNLDTVDTFIIPGMPGITDGYYELAAAFAKDGGSVYGIQMKGLKDGEAPLTTVEEMAVHNIEVIKQTDASNIQLVAHSYGGMVAFEMLKRLSEEDIHVKDVIFLDSHAPKKGIKITQIYQGLLACLRSLSGITVSDIELLEFAKRVAKKPKPRRKECVYKFILSLQGSLDPHFYDKLYEVYLSAMSVSYTTQEALNIDITLVIAKAAKRTINTQLGWTKYFKSVETIPTKVNHFELVKKPNINTWKHQLEKIELS
jgi:amino acid adenylation domain-containing protein